MQLVYNVQFNGEDVDWYRDSDRYRTWISIINLHWAGSAGSFATVRGMMVISDLVRRVKKVP